MRYWIALVALCGLIACSRHDYVYLYECDGTISKFDVGSKEPLGSWAAAKIGGLAEIVPLPIMDGCTLQQMRYDASAGALFAIAPKHASQTADPTQPYTLLAIEIPRMRVTAHVELAGSATIPQLAISKEHQLFVQYEMPREGASNETWVARYNIALQQIGSPEKSGAFPEEPVAPPLPKEIAPTDKFTYAVYADR